MTCLEANFHTWWAATSLPSAIFILSCVTPATLETRVCHSRAYFNSHPTPLLPFYLLLLDLLVPFPSTTTYALSSHVDAIAPTYQNAYKRFITRCVPPLFFVSLWIDGTPSHVVCSCLVSFILLLQPARSCFPPFTILSIPGCCTAQVLFFMFFFSRLWHTNGLCTT